MDIFAGDEIAAPAIPGRLVHQAHLLNIDRRRYCLKNFERLLKDGKKGKKGSQEIDENSNHSISQLKLTAIIPLL